MILLSATRIGFLDKKKQVQDLPYPMWPHSSTRIASSVSQTGVDLKQLFRRFLDLWSGTIRKNNDELCGLVSRM